MALTQAQIQAILSGINPSDMDGFASNPNSVISTMTAEEFKQGLECGTLSLEDLNYLFLYGFLATQKSLEVSKNYTDSQISERANFCNALSPRSGNLLQADVQPDGQCKFYYGIEPPADLANQYVDPVNGKDSNVGSRASPLRTIMKAIDRLPSGVKATIHLIDNATHYFPSSQRKYLDKSIFIYPYGATTDVAQATWDSERSGWPWYGWKNSPKANIAFVYDESRGIAEPGKVLGMCMVVLEGHTLNLRGINCITPTQNDVTGSAHWQASISGNGKITMVDCAINTPQWPLFSSGLTDSPTLSLYAVDHVGAGYVFELADGGSMNVYTHYRAVGTVNPQGLLYNNGASPAYYATKVHSRMPAVPMSPNFIANF